MLELLAATAADDLTVAEIEGFTREAAALRLAFNDALESTKAAGLKAPPVVATAAVADLEAASRTAADAA